MLPEITTRIDWLTITKSMSDQGSQVYRNTTAYTAYCNFIVSQLCPKRVPTKWSLSQSQKFFAYAYESSDSIRVCIPTQFETGKVMLQFGGRTADSGIDLHQVLISARKLDYKVTRIDVACDMKNGFPTVSLWKDTYERMAQHGRQKTSTYIASPNGDTFYLGSRSSDIMMRVYNKAAQLGLSDEWVRLEFELKGDACITLGERLVVAKDSAWPTLLNWTGMMEWKFLQQLRSIIGSGQVVKTSIPSPSSNIPQWYTDQVLPAFKKLASTDKQTALEIFEKMALVLLE